MYHGFLQKRLLACEMLAICMDMLRKCNLNRYAEKLRSIEIEL